MDLLGLVRIARTVHNFAFRSTSCQVICRTSPEPAAIRMSHELSALDGRGMRTGRVSMRRLQPVTRPVKPSVPLSASVTRGARKMSTTSKG